jgi:iron complex outermembrane recepter protein
MLKTANWLPGLTAGVTLAMLGSPSLAAENDAAEPATTAAKPPAAADESPKLEEIIVTADRKNSYGADLVQAGSFRGARQIDTPLTISVIPQEIIQSQQAAGLLDALRNTAGVTSSQTAPTVYNNIAIRGINVDNRGNFRLDGSLPIINLIDLPLEDKDRVEALKGASALYYGFTTPSGIINMTMKRPTIDPLLNITAFGDDHGGVGVHVDASGTHGMFGARINVVDAHVDSGIDQTAGSRELLAAAVDFKPWDQLLFTLDAEHIEKTVNEPGVFHFTTLPASTVGNLYPNLPLPPLLDPSTNFGATWSRTHAVENNFLGHMNWKITDAWNFTVDGGISHEERDRVSSTLNPTNFVTGAGVLSILMQPGATYNNKTERAEIAGTFYTGPFLHEVLIGAAQNYRALFTSNTVAASCPGATPGAPAIPCTQNFYDPHPIPQSPLPVPVGVLSSIDDIGTYVFDRVKFREWLQVLGGVRKSFYTEKNETTNTVTTDLEPLSYSYGVVLKPQSWVSFYATYIQGLESTPLAPVTAVNAGQQLPATESQQREAGIKIEPHPGLLVQAAFFDINRESTFVNGLNVYVQDGRAGYKGGEFSLTGEVTPELSIYLSGLYLNAKQLSGAGTVIARNGTGTVTSVSPTLVGRLIENTARTTLSVASDYRLESLLPGLSISSGVYYTGARAVDPLNRAFAPAYTLVDLGAAYQTVLMDHKTTFRVNAQNIANKRYWASTGQDFLAEGAPATVKFAVSTQF